jgi:uncharacterized protein YdhG (YjbR/CyaY superfamily)
MNRDTSPAVARVGAPTADIDNYLARIPEPARTALENLRKTIRAAAPNATEAINYKLPTFRHLGSWWVMAPPRNTVPYTS